MEIEDLKKEWDQYHEKLTRISIVKENSIKKSLSANIDKKVNGVLLYKILGIAIFGILSLYLAVRYELFIHDTKYLLPFIGFMILSIIFIVFYIYEIYILTRIDISRSTLKESLNATHKMMKYERIELFFTFTALIPILFITLIPLLTLALNRPNFYENLGLYILVSLVAIAIGLLISWFIYRDFKKKYLDLEESIRELEKLE